MLASCVSLNVCADAFRRNSNGRFTWPPGLAFYNQVSAESIAT
jgi:hypothetical protein